MDEETAEVKFLRIGSFVSLFNDTVSSLHLFEFFLFFSFFWVLKFFS